MTTRSARLVDPTTITDTPATVYTAPAGRVVLVKSLRLINVVDVGAYFYLCVNVFDAAHAVYWQASVPARGVVVDSEWWVLEPDDLLIASSSVVDAFTLMVAGAELGP